MEEGRVEEIAIDNTYGNISWGKQMEHIQGTSRYDRRSRELSKEVLRYIPNYEYILYDLSPYGKEEIKGNIQLRIFLEILK